MRYRRETGRCVVYDLCGGDTRSGVVLRTLTLETCSVTRCVTDVVVFVDRVGDQDFGDNEGYTGSKSGVEVSTR